MAKTALVTLIGELEQAAFGLPPERHGAMLRQITSLLLNNASRLDEGQISLFDEVFVRLLKYSDTSALANLSKSVCDLSPAPRETIRKLAFHSDVMVAGPVLGRSTRLSNDDLLEIVNQRGEPHLLKIAGRRTIDSSIGDALALRGEAEVVSTLIANLGAKISEIGYSALAEKAMKDSRLAEQLVRRSDLPKMLKRQLTAKIREIRTRRLLAVPPAVQKRIKDEVAKAAERSESPLTVNPEYSEALAKMATLSRGSYLNDRSINRFAVKGEYTNVIAAVTLLSGAAIEIISSLFRSADLEGLAIACKAARLDWSTTAMIIRNRPGCPTVTTEELEVARASFANMPLSIAQRTIRLW